MALPFEYLQDILQQENQQATPEFKTNYGQAAEEARIARDNAYRSMLDSRRQTLQKQRTDDLAMAKYNALGKVLTTMVQPIGWAVGGSTAATPQYDDRQYLESFNRAVRANDDFRNIGMAEDEYRFKMADDEYRRQLALADYENKAKIEMEKQRQLFDLRSQLNQEQIEGRIRVAEASARAKYNFSTNGKKVSESVRDNLLKRANTAYASILADYYKKKQVGMENLQEPPTYDQFLQQFASENGYSVAETQNAKEKEQPAEDDFSGYKRGGNTSASKPAEDDFSQYKRN